MKAALSPSNHQYLLRFLKSSHSPPTASLFLRRLCSEPAAPAFRNDDAIISQAVKLLQAPDSELDTAQLNHLLFSNDDASSTSSSSNARLFLHIGRNLPSSSHALKFLDYLQNDTPSPPGPESLSLALQAVFEVASRESDPGLSRLIETSKERNIPLTANAVTLLLRCFGRSRMVEEALAFFNELDPSVKDTHAGNVMISVLFRCGRVDDALKVLDEMLQSDEDSDFVPNDATGDIVFSALLNKRRAAGLGEIVDWVLRLRDRGVFPGSVWMTQLITRLCVHGDVNRAWDILHDMIKVGAVVDARPCNALLTGLGKEGDFKRMNELMARMKEVHIHPSVVTFGVIINHMCKLRQVDLALEVLQKMSEGTESDGVSVEPDTIIYNTLINGLCKVGRQDEGLKLMERMRLQTGCAPTAPTYNCLIDGLCRAGEIERAKELFEDMQKDGVEPNVITMNSMIGGMCRNGRIHSAVEFLKEMQGKGLKANSVTYTAFITAFCGVNNIAKAKEFFDQMLTTGTTPDAIVYYSLISGLSQAGRMDEASFVLSRMREAGFRPDRLCYNVLLGGLCRTNKKDRAYELLQEMEESGLKPDAVTYNTAISYFGKIGDLQSASRALTKMVEDGIVPTVVTYGAIIHAYCSDGKIDDAMKIFEQMKAASKIPPNTVIYNILIDSLCKNKEVKRALSLMEDMAMVGVRPNATTYNAIFKGLRDERWSAEAFKLMDRMIEQACNPDYITMEILTEWLPAIGETEKLKKFVNGYEVSASTA
ncbi:hypothetical protein Tsubulata_024355 [Turnera subulata]|uniref:Pentacotripeptide-repeat region of PRORP domain-containing protein n=1 Tax=Turnera subulata TaxID=218843 RepID=A0A9Q0G7Z2_9ROSI|nr:hypothetical protein Tsubulata_024355 [Turnera subulata]